jgi:hypothetical protein
MQLCKTYAAAECELSMKVMGLAWGTYPLAHPWAGLKNEDSDCPLRSVTRNACEDMYALLLHPVVYAGLVLGCTTLPANLIVERSLVGCIRNRVSQVIIPIRGLSQDGGRGAGPRACSAWSIHETSACFTSRPGRGWWEGWQWRWRGGIPSTLVCISITTANDHEQCVDNTNSIGTSRCLWTSSGTCALQGPRCDGQCLPRRVARGSAHHRIKRRASG